MRLFSLWYIARKSGLIGLIQTLFFNKGSSFKAHREYTSNANPNPKKKNKMVPCEKCQLYIPEDEAFFYKGKAFCSKEHSK